MRNVDAVLLATMRVPPIALQSAKTKIKDSDELWQYFVKIKQVTEADVFHAMARTLKLQFFNLRVKEISNEALAYLSAPFCRKENLIPVEVREDQIVIATPYPDNFAAIDEIVASTGLDVVVAIVAPSDLIEAFDRYLRTDQEIDKLSEQIEQALEDETDEDDLGDLDDESPVVRFVNLLIAQGIQDRASDIHVEPGERELTVRYRIDGVLKIVQNTDASIQKGVVSRLKVMSNIDIGEKRKPQDGRLSLRHAGKTIDIRVVTLPTTWGEKVVMRILDHSDEKRTIESIEMSPENQAIFERCIGRSHGMILVTGPTGSGKALPLDTKIPTPFGFTTMGEIKEDDQVIGGNGKVYKVTSTSEVDEFAELYELTLSDGQKVIADADHQWLVSTAAGRAIKSSKRKKQAIEKYVESHKTLTKLAYLSLEFSPEFGSRTSDEILNLLKKEGINYYSTPRAIDQSLHMVNLDGFEGVREVSKSTSVAVKEYPIEDALMGLATRIRQQHAVVQSAETPVIRVTTSEMFENGLFVGETSRKNYAVPVNGALELPEADLDEQSKIASYENLNKNLRGSFEQRLDFVKCLVDAHGFVSDSGEVSLTVDEDYVSDTVQIIRSLGIKAVVNSNEITFTTDLKISNISENLNNLPKKLDEDSKWNYVSEIKPLGRGAVKCISVSSPDFTYLVGEGFVTTSNSTTIYTALGLVAEPSVNVVTVEDPVEKKIPGISQIQINNKAGMTFSSALRSILRADPDIVFLGEIRDEETAKIAVDASMTGHLVLSTLHTNGAPESAARLTEMGVEPYLVGSSVSCVVAQRLARRLCNDCKEETTIDRETMDKAEFPYYDAQMYRTVGCNLCAQTGYRGRIALTEVMEITEAIEPYITSQKSANEIRRVAEDHGLVSLRDDGYKKVRDGFTTIEEVMRVAS